LPATRGEQRLVDRFPGAGKLGLEQRVGDLAMRLLGAVSVQLLGLAVPIRNRAADRLTHDDRVVGKLEQTLLLTELLEQLLALGVVAPKADASHDRALGVT